MTTYNPGGGSAHSTTMTIGEFLPLLNGSPAANDSGFNTWAVVVADGNGQIMDSVKRLELRDGMLIIHTDLGDY